MITLRGVLAQDVGDWWARVEPWVAAALEHGPRLYDASDVLAEILSRDMQLWVICDGEEPCGVAVTSVVAFPRRTLLIIRLVGGVDARRWIGGLDDLLAAYARGQGCDFQFFEGRPGWDRFVGAGWKATSTQYIREVTP